MLDPVNCEFWSPKGLAGNCAIAVKPTPSRAFCHERCDRRQARDPNKPIPVQVKVRTKVWPQWARFISRRRQDGETGVGDTLARLIDGVGGSLYKRLMAKMNRQCGCQARQAVLNRDYPYPPPTHEKARPPST